MGSVLRVGWCKYISYGAFFSGDYKIWVGVFFLRLLVLGWVLGGNVIFFRGVGSSFACSLERS